MRGRTVEDIRVLMRRLALMAEEVNISYDATLNLYDGDVNHFL